MNEKHQKILLTIGLILYILGMIIGAIIPNPDEIPVFSGNTSYFHFFGFIVLSFMIFRITSLYKFKYGKIYSVIFLGFFVILTESLQLFVETRSFSTEDMLVDIIGSIIGFGFYYLIFRKK